MPIPEADAYLGHERWADPDAEIARCHRRITDLEGEIATWRLAAKGHRQLAGELMQSLARVTREVSGTNHYLLEAFARLQQRFDALEEMIL